MNVGMAEHRSENQFAYFFVSLLLLIFILYWEVITREPSKRNPKSTSGLDNPADQERKFNYSEKRTMDALYDHLGHI
jgi:hypothetical protein